MQRTGLNCCVYLDDFVLYENTIDKCATSFTAFISLLTSLGFDIAWSKVVHPCKQLLLFFGIEIDLQESRLSLDRWKQVKSSLCFRKPPPNAEYFSNNWKKDGRKRQLGMHCFQVRPDLHKCYFVYHVPTHTPSHKCGITPPILHALIWWINAFSAPISTAAYDPVTAQVIIALLTAVL